MRDSQRQRQRADGDAATLEHDLGFRHVTSADRGCRTRPALEQIASLAHSAVAEGVAIPVDLGYAAKMDVKTFRTLSKVTLEIGSGLCRESLCHYMLVTDIAE